MDSFSNLFKRRKYASVDQSAHFGARPAEKQEKKASPNIPDGLWMRCGNCEEVVYTKDVEDNLNVCTKCGYHFKMGARKRLSLIIDEGTFLEFDSDMRSINPLDYPDYEIKLAQNEKKSGEKEAVITGQGKIGRNETVIAVMDPNFLMGSLGSVVGEKITRAVEKAVELKLPIIIFTTGGGARMQEGILSLMQMAKTSAAVAKHNEAGLLYITVLTDPTTGGITASYAMLGDIILAEPGALVGFAGPRVIEQTIKQKLPAGFQKSEFLLEKGFVDHIVERKNLKSMLSYLLEMHKKSNV